MAIRVGIVSKHCSQWEYISDQLEADRRFQIAPLLTPAQAEQRLNHETFDLVLVCLERFDESHLPMVEKLRQKLPGPMLVFMAREISVQARFMLQGRGLHAALLLAELDLEQIAPILWKLWSTQQTNTRLHPRMPRQETVELLFQNGTLCRGQFRDFGKMGASVVLELPESHTLAPQDRVLMTYLSTSQGVSLRVESCVTWVDKASIGLQFLAVH